MITLTGVVRSMIISTQGTSPRARLSLSKVMRRIANNRAYPISYFDEKIQDITTQEIQYLITLNRVRTDTCEFKHAATIIILDENLHTRYLSRGFNDCVQGDTRRD